MADNDRQWFNKFADQIFAVGTQQQKSVAEIARERLDETSKYLDELAEQFAEQRRQLEEQLADDVADELFDKAIRPGVEILLAELEKERRRTDRWRVIAAVALIAAFALGALNLG